MTKNGNNVSVNDIPSGYKLSDLDTEGHSAQLLQWPNSISVVSDGTTPTDPGHETKPDNPATPTYPYQSVPDGTSKTVTFVDASGKQVGTGTLTKNGNNVSLSDIPGGYKLADEDAEGHSAQLLQWPDTINVVSDGTNQPSTPTYPFQNVADGTTKGVTFVDADGKQVGTGTLTKNGNNVSVDGIPGGYKLSDLDTEGHSAQLLQWPDTISVVSDGTSQPSNPDNPTYPAQSIPDGTSKQVQFVTSDGIVIGTGTLSKAGNSVQISDIPGGYKLSDLDAEGHSAQLLQWPDTISVISDGTSQPSKPNNPNTPTYPAQDVADGTAKEVTFIDKNGNQVGTGTLTKNGNSISVDGIPGGYKLSDLDTDGHSAQLLQWPNSITVVSDGSSVQPGGSTNSDQPSTPTYPFQSVPDGTSKIVAFVDASGNQVGTGTLTKNGNSVHLSGIPGGYKLSDEDSQGHSAQLYQWPNSITVISDGSSVQPSGNTNPDQSSNSTYPAQSIPDGTSKQVQFVTFDGTVVGTGTLTKRNGGVAVDGIPGGYQMTDLDSQGHSMQLWNWPDKLTVMSVNSLDVAKYIHA
ncbi:Ferrous iron transport protein B [Chlamydia trachomatis]|nr:Ferrous iron transport protein B [Chlamydia trachomatis]